MKIKAFFTKRECVWVWVFYTMFFSTGFLAGRYTTESIFYPLGFLTALLIIILIFGEKDKK